MRLSFIILSYRRPDLLRRCLDSLDRCGMGDETEAWIGFNGRDPSQTALIDEISRRHGWARIVQLERTSRGNARNQLIRRALGDILFVLDDDTTVPPDFVGLVLEKFDRFPQAAVLGGPNVAPPDSGAFERAADRFFCSPVTAGPFRIRFVGRGTDRPLPSECFQLSNLGFRREVFDRGLSFPADCVSAEENLLLFQTERLLGPAIYSPDLFVYHRRRGRLIDFCRQLFSSGRGRMQIIRQETRSLNPIVLLPPAGLLYVLAAPWIRGGAAALWPAGAYLTACSLTAVSMAAEDRDIKGALWFIPLAVLGHLSYALGFLAGLLPGSVMRARDPRLRAPVESKACAASS